MQTSGNGSRTPGNEPERRRTVREILADGRAVEVALKRGVREALIVHKKLGQSIVVWRDGKVVELPPDEIPV